MKPIRLKTTWFKNADSKTPQEIATVLASVIWRLADRFTANLSQADYDIITPDRGFKLLAEFVAFQVQFADRLAYENVSEETRTAFIQTMSTRLAEIMDDNIRESVGEDAEGYDYKAGFIDLLNRRLADYAQFGLVDGKPDFAAMCYLGNACRDIMEKRDQPWIIDQIMEIEAPAAVDTVRKGMQGLLPPT